MHLSGKFKWPGKKGIGQPGTLICQKFPTAGISQKSGFRENRDLLSGLLTVQSWLSDVVPVPEAAAGAQVILHPVSLKSKYK